MTAAQQTLSPSRENVLDAGPSRGLAVMALATISVALVTSAIWRPAATSPFGDYFTLCGFKNLTGLPCPGCGLTHSFCALAKGDVTTALAFNLLGPVLFTLMLLVWVRSIAVLWGKLRFVERFDRAIERFRVVKRVTVACLAFGLARVVYVLIFHAESFRVSPVGRFVSSLLN